MILKINIKKKNPNKNKLEDYPKNSGALLDGVSVVGDNGPWSWCCKKYNRKIKRKINKRINANVDFFFFSTLTKHLGFNALKL